MVQRGSARFSLTSQIVLGMIVGAIVGSVMGLAAAPFGEIGKIIIHLIKVIAVPMVFFAIIEAILTTYIPRKNVFRLLFIAGINAVIAAAIGLTLSKVFKPGAAMHGTTSTNADISTAAQGLAGNSISVKALIQSNIPENIIDPFTKNSLISVVLLAVVIGIGARAASVSLAKESAVFQGLTLFANKVFEHLLRWLVLLVPLAVFGATAATVGKFGFAPFSGLAMYLVVGILGLSLQIVVVYQTWIRWVGGIPLRKFWKEARGALVYSFGTNSSLATLPLTLSTLDTLGVSRASSRLGACVGTNLNNDGILLYETMAVLFVAQAMGLELSIGQQLFAAVFCLIAAVGVAGVPEAGVISLSLVLTTIGLPLDLLPQLLTVDWLIARVRSVTNVMSDMTISIALDRWKSEGLEPLTR